MERIGSVLRTLCGQLILWGMLVMIGLALLGLFGSVNRQSLPAESPVRQVVVASPAITPPLQAEDSVHFSLPRHCTDRAMAAWETGHADSARIGGPVCDP